MYELRLPASHAQLVVISCDLDVDDHTPPYKKVRQAARVELDHSRYLIKADQSPPVLPYSIPVVYRMSVGDESQPGHQLLQPEGAGQLQLARATSNDASLFDILPPELFAKILSNVYVLIRKTEIPWDKNWTIPYQLVRRRWRDIICSTPQLWQEICICSSPRWFEFCLTRCAGAPATVLVFRPTQPIETYAMLRRYASSIKECRIHSLVALMLGFPSLLATPMPTLETLSVDGVVYYGDDPADIPITHEHFPRLTTLDLRTCTAPLDTAVYTSLQILRLISCVWAISYGEFLRVLGECHALQYLCLDEDILDSFMEQVAEPTVNHPIPTTPVVLPRLRRLKLAGKPDPLFHLLSAVHAPQVTKIELTGGYDSDNEESGLIITRLLAPNPQLRYPFLSSPRTVSLCCWDGAPFKLTLRCGPLRNALFSVDFGPSYRGRGGEYPGENADLQPNLVAIMDIFPVASVDTLEIEGCLDQAAVETWQRVFQTFPNLRTLTLRGNDTLDPVWQGLARATASSVQRDGTLCCPLLSEITMDGGPDSPTSFSATVTLFEAIRAALGARIAAGAGTRLKKLKLRLEYTQELWTRTYRDGLGSGALESVRALVEELDYQDWRES